MASGLYWFRDSPLALAEKFSVAADEVGDQTGDIVSTAVDHAVQTMRQTVLSGGVNKTQKGGARVLSGDMFGAIEGNVEINGRRRVQGEVGFIDAPDYTKYQEDGTKYIASMLAFATALQQLQTELQSQFSQGKWLPRNLR